MADLQKKKYVFPKDKKKEMKASVKQFNKLKSAVCELDKFKLKLTA